MKDNTLAINGGSPVISKAYKHPTWPVIDESYEEAVVDQLYTSVSIYNRSGIIKEFEEKFAKIHGKKYALLCNSGTNALWSMYVSAGLMPGDEVLCPTYTFFATNTPLLSSGVRPVFCDALESGNIDPNEIEKKITKKTKAIVITHMWGYPCDMDRIKSIADKHGLLLFEDCSHAHLAKWRGKYVGSFGDAALWSLQGQKNITGGEGGILLTNNEDMYVRANLHGHYNKRCKDEIPEGHELREFAVTGMGLKMRSHPLAVAIANKMLDDHSDYQEIRNYCAEQYSKLLSNYDFIELQKTDSMEPSWYAYILKLKPNYVGRREEIVEMLHEEGLLEVDIPDSTGPNHLLPLFKKPWILFPQFYRQDEPLNVNDTYPVAQEFYESVIKLPTWTRPEHKEILSMYLEGLKKVFDNVKP